MCKQIVKLDLSELPFKERAIIFSLKENVISWDELSQPTVKKYRDLLQNQSKTKDIQEELLNALYSSSDQINTEIQSYL